MTPQAADRRPSTPIAWNVSREDHSLVVQIAQRAVRDYPDAGFNFPTLVMDLTATHLNGCPLDLDKLLAAPAVDFAHDLGGISRHIDRTTGQLGGCFLPRCARAEILPSTLNTPATERRVRRAFRAWWRAQGHSGSLNFDTTFEHGHWWVIAHPPQSDESRTFDAVDATGGDAVAGFSFEEV